jgi:TPR repeat protein
VKEDPAQAVAWWRKSAAQGFAPAMFNLGFSYMSGIGTKRKREGVRPLPKHPDTKPALNLSF